MNRSQQILAAVLVMQLILAAFVFWPRAATGGVTPLFPDLASEDVTTMVITDDQGKSVELRQVSGEWVLPEADDYPAKGDSIKSVLGKIAGLTSQRLVTRTEASHKRLQVAADDFVRRVDLRTSGGVARTLYLGSSPSYGASHVRAEGQNETYLTNDLTQWDINAAPSSWVDVSYLSVSQDEVTRVTLRNTHGTLDLVKDEQGNWTLSDVVVGEQLDVGRINSLISRATLVTMTRPLGREELPEYGMDNPNAAVTIHKAEETITLLVGAQDPSDSSYVVKASTSPYYVRVGSYNVTDMVQNTRQDLLQPPPTPTATE